MARRYGEWPGENYEGSSARGAMKGWHQHGGFDDDEATLKATLVRILGGPAATVQIPSFRFQHSAARQRDIRRDLMSPGEDLVPV